MTDPGVVRVAVGQVPFSPDVEVNVEAAATAARLAADLGARLLVLSELALSGYRLAGLPASERVIAPDDPRLAPLVEASRALAVLAGAAVPSGGGGTANAVMLLEGGRPPAVVYRKNHLWGSEEEVFTAGRDLTVLSLAGLRVGLGICFDAGFPEHARAYAHAGVDLLAYSSSFLVGDEAGRYEVYHAARALESGCHVAVSDTCGHDGDDVFYGRSRCYDPFGRLLADAGPQAGLVVVDVEPAACARARAALPYLDLLHPEYPITDLGAAR